MRPSHTHLITRWASIALVCALALLVLACDHPVQPDTEPDVDDIVWNASGRAAKIQLEFDVYLPDPDWVSQFRSNRTLRAVKRKVLRSILRDLRRGLDQFAVYRPGSGPMNPPTLLDETMTLGELGLVDGSRIVIKPQ